MSVHRHSGDRRIRTDSEEVPSIGCHGGSSSCGSVAGDLRSAGFVGSATDRQAARVRSVATGRSKDVPTDCHSPEQPTLGVQLKQSARPRGIVGRAFSRQGCSALSDQRLAAVDLGHDATRSRPAHRASTARTPAPAWGRWWLRSRAPLTLRVAVPRWVAMAREPGAAALEAHEHGRAPCSTSSRQLVPR